MAVYASVPTAAGLAPSATRVLPGVLVRNVTAQSPGLTSLVAAGPLVRLNDRRLLEGVSLGPKVVAGQPDARRHQLFVSGRIE